jgi:hypothetical protein
MKQAVRAAKDTLFFLYICNKNIEAPDPGTEPIKAPIKGCVFLFDSITFEKPFFDNKFINSKKKYEITTQKITFANICNDVDLITSNILSPYIKV